MSNFKESRYNQQSVTVKNTIDGSNPYSIFVHTATQLIDPDLTLLGEVPFQGIKTFNFSEPDQYYIVCTSDPFNNNFFGPFNGGTSPPATLSYPV